MARIPVNEIVNGHRVRCYDNGGRTYDRYTVVFLDMPERQYNTFLCVGMSGPPYGPFHPRGFCQHDSATIGRHLGRRIRFDDLPEDCRKLVHPRGMGQCVIYNNNL